MAKTVQFVGGTEAEMNALTGLTRQVTVDTTNKELRVHDGSTAGGVPVARKDLANVATATSSAAGKMSAVQAQKLDGLPTSVVAQATSVTGTGYLTGGGDLSASRTLDIATAIKTIIDNAEALITEISATGNQHAVESLGALSSAGTTVDVIADAVFTATCSAASVIDLAALPDRAWSVELQLTDADTLSAVDTLFQDTINWVVGDGTYSTTFSDQPITVGSTLTVLLWGYNNTTIYGVAR